MAGLVSTMNASNQLDLFSRLSPSLTSTVGSMNNNADASQE
jgi:hypothetical protein